MGAEAIKGETVFLAGPCLCSGDCGRGTSKLSVHLPTAKEVDALPGPILQMRKMRFRNLLKVPQPFSGRDVVAPEQPLQKPRSLSTSRTGAV